MINHKLRQIRRLVLAVIALVFACSALGQRLEREPTPSSETRPPRYLGENAIDYRSLIAPPPTPGSFEDNADIASVKAVQNVDDENYKSAQLDSAFLYPRFEDAFGHPIDRASFPQLVKLLNRTLQEVGAV